MINKIFDVLKKNIILKIYSNDKHYPLESLINNEIIKISSFNQSIEDAFELYSTIEFADKSSNKKSIIGLNNVVENLKYDENKLLEIISIELDKKYYTIIIDSDTDKFYGYLESIKLGYR